MTPERELIKQLRDALDSSDSHHVFCGWGDVYERECARANALPDRITAALYAANEYLEEKK